MHKQNLAVHFVPRHVPEAALTDSTVVVVDVLRASTTICAALASGAAEVVPLLEVSDALAAAAEADRAEVVLGGERNGRRIEGFDLGNSPAEYSPDRVRGRRVLLTTTNGTRALSHARLAHRVIVGAVVNLSAVVASVKNEPRVDILCAGTDGRETREDILAAGAMVEQLLAINAALWQLNHSAQAARSQWQQVLRASRDSRRTPNEQLAIELRNTHGGRNLLAIGLDADLVDCAQIDRLDIVPVLDTRAWRIALP